uniref:Uncharacterized protein n=1 Tax=Glossina pallidipes TaxID=7398 RepID=A0A1A9ZG71_GLOPL
MRRCRGASGIIALVAVVTVGVIGKRFPVEVRVFSFTLNAAGDVCSFGLPCAFGVSLLLEDVEQAFLSVVPSSVSSVSYVRWYPTNFLGDVLVHGITIVHGLTFFGRDDTEMAVQSSKI